MNNTYSIKPAEPTKPKPKAEPKPLQVVSLSEAEVKYFFFSLIPDLSKDEVKERLEKGEEVKTELTSKERRDAAREALAVHEGRLARWHSNRDARRLLRDFDIGHVRKLAA